jgi:hypothetical protein
MEMEHRILCEEELGSIYLPRTRIQGNGARLKRRKNYYPPNCATIPVALQTVSDYTHKRDTENSALL